MKLKLLVYTCFFTLSCGIGTASAYNLPIDTTPGLTYNNILHDTSGEGITGNSSTVDIGTVLSGNAVFDKINTTNIGQNGYDELTAYFSVEVTGRTAEDRTINGTVYHGYAYTFDAVSGNGGVMAWLFTDSTPDANFGNPTTFGNAGTDGSTLWATFGNTDPNQTQWTAWTATDDIATLAGYVKDHPTTASDYGTFTFYLNLINNFTGLTFNDVGNDPNHMTQLQGQGHFQAVTSDYASVYTIGDQTDMSINVVPEPATMTLFGLGLMGTGLIGRLRRKKISDETGVSV
jgi:hypothetical protein